MLNQHFFLTLTTKQKETIAQWSHNTPDWEKERYFRTTFRNTTHFTPSGKWTSNALTSLSLLLQDETTSADIRSLIQKCLSPQEVFTIYSTIIQDISKNLDFRVAFVEELHALAIATQGLNSESPWQHLFFLNLINQGTINKLLHLLKEIVAQTLNGDSSVTPLRQLLAEWKEFKENLNIKALPYQVGQHYFLTQPQSFNKFYTQYSLLTHIMLWYAGLSEGDKTGTGTSYNAGPEAYNSNFLFQRALSYLDKKYFHQEGQKPQDPLFESLGLESAIIRLQTPKNAFDTCTHTNSSAIFNILINSTSREKLAAISLAATPTTAKKTAPAPRKEDDLDPEKLDTPEAFISYFSKIHDKNIPLNAIADRAIPLFLLKIKSHCPPKKSLAQYLHDTWYTEQPNSVFAAKLADILMTENNFEQWGKTQHELLLFYKIFKSLPNGKFAQWIANNIMDGKCRFDSLFLYAHAFPATARTDYSDVIQYIAAIQNITVGKAIITYCASLRSTITTLNILHHFRDRPDPEVDLVLQVFSTELSTLISSKNLPPFLNCNSHHAFLFLKNISFTEDTPSAHATLQTLLQSILSDPQYIDTDSLPHLLSEKMCNHSFTLDFLPTLFEHNVLIPFVKKQLLENTWDCLPVLLRKKEPKLTHCIIGALSEKINKMIVSGYATEDISNEFLRIIQAVLCSVDKFTPGEIALIEAMDSLREEQQINYPQKNTLCHILCDNYSSLYHQKLLITFVSRLSHFEFHEKHNSLNLSVSDAIRTNPHISDKGIYDLFLDQKNSAFFEKTQLALFQKEPVWFATQLLSQGESKSDPRQFTLFTVDNLNQLITTVLDLGLKQEKKKEILLLLSDWFTIQLFSSEGCVLFDKIKFLITETDVLDSLTREEWKNFLPVKFFDQSILETILSTSKNKGILTEALTSFTWLAPENKNILFKNPHLTSKDRLEIINTAPLSNLKEYKKHFYMTELNTILALNEIKSKESYINAIKSHFSQTSEDLNEAAYYFLLSLRENSCHILRQPKKNTFLLWDVTAQNGLTKSYMELLHFFETHFEHPDILKQVYETLAANKLEHRFLQYRKQCFLIPKNDSRILIPVTRPQAVRLHYYHNPDHFLNDNTLLSWQPNDVIPKLTRILKDLFGETCTALLSNSNIQHSYNKAGCFGNLSYELSWRAVAKLSESDLAFVLTRWNALIHFIKRDKTHLNRYRSCLPFMELVFKNLLILEKEMRERTEGSLGFRVKRAILHR